MLYTSFFSFGSVFLYCQFALSIKFDCYMNCKNDDPAVLYSYMSYKPDMCLLFTIYCHDQSNLSWIVFLNIHFEVCFRSFKSKCLCWRTAVTHQYFISILPLLKLFLPLPKMFSFLTQPCPR